MLLQQNLSECFSSGWHNKWLSMKNNTSCVVFVSVSMLKQALWNVARQVDLGITLTTADFLGLHFCLNVSDCIAQTRVFFFFAKDEVDLVYFALPVDIKYEYGNSMVVSCSNR